MFFTLFAGMACLSDPAFSYNRPEKILIIHSYHKGLVWTDSEEEGMRQILDRHHEIEVFTEYLDTKRINNTELEQAYLVYLKTKYNKNIPDVIIVSDNNALSFLKRNYTGLFSSALHVIPIVFCGINNFTPDMLKGFVSPVTGVVEAFDMLATVNLMGILNKNLEHIVIITGASRIADSVEQQAKKALAPYREPQRFRWWHAQSSEQLFAGLAGLSSNDAVLFITFSRDKHGRYYPYNQISSMVVKKSAAPVYVLFEQNIGTGTVGGVVISGMNQGKNAAEMAISILKTGKIPLIINKSPNKTIIDYDAASRHGLNLSGLDQSAFILNRPVSFFLRYRTLIIGAVVILAALVLALIGILSGLLKARRSEMMFRTLIEKASIAIQVYDKNGQSLMANKAWADLWHSRPSDFIGKYNVLEDRLLMNTELYPLLKQSFEGSVVDLPEMEYDPEQNGKRGRKRIVKSMAFPIKNGDQVVKVVVMQQDITKQKNVEEEKKILEKQLIHKSKMDAIGQLAGGIAHDFNNMLAGIIGSAQLLQTNENLDEQSLRFINIILSASERAVNLIAKLMAFSRKGKIESARIHIKDIINDTVEILKRTIDKKIIITTSYDAQNDIVSGDSSALQNTLINLGINASHAMPEGGKLIYETANVWLDEIYCRANMFDIVPGRYVQINIKDTGCGIERRYLDRIFEPFFTTKGHGKGTGLGLAAVYGTVQDHNGSINVYSEPGTGTVFKIFLPVARETCDNGDADAVSECELPVPGTGTILVVDDEKIVRETCSYMLKDLGYKVISASNGGQAVDIFKSQYHDIDLVLLDIVMPDMNGREVFFILKEIHKECRIVISSGFAMDETINSLEQAGVDGFIVKPYTRLELSRLVADVLSSDGKLVKKP